MDDVFRALADRTRRRLLDSLNARNGQNLSDLCQGLDMARQSVTKHLAILEAADLVVTIRRGRERLHYLNAAPIHEIADRWIDQYHRERVRALADLKDALEDTTVHMQSFVYKTYIKTTPEQLWRALTEPAFTKRYWGVALVSDWNAGSTVTWELPKLTIADDEQVVLTSEPPHRLSYTWHTVTPEFVAAYGADQDFLAKASKERRSKVTFEIEPVGEMVKLTVTHDAFDPGSVVLAGVSQGWPPIIASLKTLLETGEPLPFPLV